MFLVLDVQGRTSLRRGPGVCRQSLYFILHIPLDDSSYGLAILVSMFSLWFLFLFYISLSFYIL
jgi:hypothetical protein